jgi:hypothetical protein
MGTHGEEFCASYVPFVFPASSKQVILVCMDEWESHHRADSADSDRIIYTLVEWSQCAKYMRLLYDFQ